MVIEIPGWIKWISRQKNARIIFPGLSISSIYKDADGTIWAGTLGGLYRYNRKTDNFNSIAEDNPGNDIVQVEAITGDQEDNLWMSTETGIYMLNKKRDHVIHIGKEYGLPEANNFFLRWIIFYRAGWKVVFRK